MRKFLLIFKTILFCALIPIIVYGQYTETFSLAGKGIIAGPCGALSTTCSSFDFSSVNWDIEGNLSGLDTEGFLTVNGAMTGADVDEEVCWISPILNLTSAANISVALSWTLYENGDYIRAEYQLNGGSWNPFGGISIPVGGAEQTSGNTATAMGIGATGSTLQVRVCGDNNLTSEIFTLDNVNVTNASVLPVNWLSIHAYNEKNKNTIDWQTATESNNDYFEIQRSTDGIHYTALGQVKGSGNTTNISNYAFDDETIKLGNTYYYRVKQIDFDGKYDYSPIVSVRNTDDVKYEVSPNPFNDFLTFTTNDDDMNKTINIFNHLGLKLKEFTGHNETFDTNDLLPGIYIVQFPTKEVVKLIKL